MAAASHYLAVLKAAYDYTADSKDEISVKEDQIVFLIERTDDDWWKVKPRDADESFEGGLVPAAYVEPAPHRTVVKALYDYDASAPGELSIKEDDVLLAFDAEDGWLLVQTEKDGGKAGFVPENYVEPTDTEVSGQTEPQEEEEEVPAAPAIIVPPSPPRPSAPYVDPAERVAQSHTMAPATDNIKTWAVSEVDKKGKKKKGTLGIGNGSVFFASESDKTPVQKWPTSDVENSYTEKSKHVHIEIGGATPIHLHFNAGSRDTAETIIEKLDSSRAAAKAALDSADGEGEAPTPAPVAPAEQAAREEVLRTAASPKPKKNGVSVHFAQRPPSIITPREPSISEPEEEEEYVDSRAVRAKEDSGNEWCTVLYDFTADGDDELSVSEGDRLIVLDRDSDDWWKVRDNMGRDGVVPASYVELDETTVAPVHANGHTDRSKEVARRAQEDRERQEAERLRAEQEQKARMAAEAAEAERRRRERERERERKAKEEEERHRREEEEEEEERKRAERQARAASSSGHPRPSEEQRMSTSSARASSDKPRSHPDPAKVRTWHDRTGQFKVDAQFLGFSNNKLRLHKTNGVVIEVPVEKMSHDDLKYVDRLQGRDPRRTMSPESDDETLAVTRQSLQSEPKKAAPPKKGKPFDWFEFFLNAGCDLDDCTRYASSFERDKIDESILPDITEQTMRSLGLREGDIIRVNKAIQQRTGGGASAATLEEQMKKDAELARKLQEEEGKSTLRGNTMSPGLFAGPGGALRNNTRRGRPQPSRSTPPATVDLQSIATASEQITRMDSPLAGRVSSPVSAPPRASSAAPIVSGFDDDAWTNRPISTQPTAPNPRAPSAPPTQMQPAAQSAAPPPLPTQPSAPAPVQPAQQPQATTTSPPVNTTSTGSSLARTTESDVFEQLARLRAVKSQIPATKSPLTAPASAPVSAMSPPLASFTSGLGMGSSPAPIGQLQTQATSFQQQQNGPRGPFAPVPANQGLLQPLIPTTTGFNSFVPTRPATNPPSFNATSPQPSFLNTQPTGLPPAGTLASQPRGFPGSTNFQNTGFSPASGMQTGGFGSGIQTQPTGLPSTGPLMAQTTSYPGALGSGPFSGGRAFGPLQPNVTGFNPGFGQASSPPPPVPPVPPLPSNLNNNDSTSPANVFAQMKAAKDTAPANVFAQMKSGTFANDSAPQQANKYNALRPQPTGWGMQNGYSGSFY